MPDRAQLVVNTIGRVPTGIPEAIKASLRAGLEAAGCTVTKLDEEGNGPCLVLTLFVSRVGDRYTYCMTLSLEESVVPERNTETVVRALTWTTWKMDLSGSAGSDQLRQAADEALQAFLEHAGGNERAAAPSGAKVKVNVSIDVKLDVQTGAEDSAEKP